MHAGWSDVRRITEAAAERAIFERGVAELRSVVGLAHVLLHQKRGPSVAGAATLAQLSFCPLNRFTGGTQIRQFVMAITMAGQEHVVYALRGKTIGDGEVFRACRESA
jgi:hypothetical protein